MNLEGKGVFPCFLAKNNFTLVKVGPVTLLVTPGLEAPEEFDGLGGSKSSLGGTGGRDD